MVEKLVEPGSWRSWEGWEPHRKRVRLWSRQATQAWGSPEWDPGMGTLSWADTAQTSTMGALGPAPFTEGITVPLFKIMNAILKNLHTIQIFILYHNCCLCTYLFSITPKLYSWLKKNVRFLHSDALSLERF